MATDNSADIIPLRKQPQTPAERVSCCPRVGGILREYRRVRDELLTRLPQLRNLNTWRLL
jgi:hypothetical protein